MQYLISDSIALWTFYSKNHKLYQVKTLIIACCNLRILMNQQHETPDMDDLNISKNIYKKKIKHSIKPFFQRYASSKKQFGTKSEISSLTKLFLLFKFMKINK